MAFRHLPLLIGVLEEEEERLNWNLTRRTLRDASDPLELPEYMFKGMYRISRQTAHDLILEISPFMRDPNREEIFIPKQLKVLVALHFLAQGSYQKGCGQDLNIPMCQASVSNCINEFVNVVNDNFRHYVKFPTTQEEINEEKQKFMNVPNGFPGIIGCIDGTHVAIIAPPFNDEFAPGILFYNRKGFYSLNAEIIVGADLRILAINPRYPGSVHDAGIWAASAVRHNLLHKFNQGMRSTWLLGDSGYPLEPWLMTPLLNVATPQERRYNNAHKSIRNVSERLNGVLKSRFRCTLRHRALNYSPTVAGKIINTCGILHNYCLLRNDAYENEQQLIDDDQDFYDDNDDRLPDARVGRNTRNTLILTHF